MSFLHCLGINLERDGRNIFFEEMLQDMKDVLCGIIYVTFTSLYGQESKIRR